MGAFVDLTGNRYGRLTVLAKSPEKKNRIEWICLCDCGKETIVRGNNLRSGNTKSCGCFDLENKLNKFHDLTGRTFGRLTVLQRDGYAYKPSGSREIKWMCVCDCGNQVSVTATHLNNGDTTSCGCYFRNMASQRYTHDLTGRRFGKLTVLQRVSKPGDTDGVKWRCKCDCGYFTNVRAISLTKGLTRSCGCLKMSKGESCIYREFKKHGIEFEREYIFDDLLSEKGNPLRFDFALFDRSGSLKGLLEFQGIQHYEERSLCEDFGKQQREVTDAQKRKYCQDRNIKLIEIKYDDDLECATLSAIMELYANPVPSAVETAKV